MLSRAKNWAVAAYAHAPFSPKFLMGFCSDGPCECSGQIFTRSWDNWGYPKNLGSPWIRSRSPFSEIFNDVLWHMLTKLVQESFRSYNKVVQHFLIRNWTVSLMILLFLLLWRHSAAPAIQGAAKKMTQHVKCDYMITHENFCAKFCTIV